MDGPKEKLIKPLEFFSSYKKAYLVISGLYVELPHCVIEQALPLRLVLVLCCMRVQGGIFLQGVWCSFH